MVTNLAFLNLDGRRRMRRNGRRGSDVNLRCYDDDDIVVDDTDEEEDDDDEDSQYASALVDFAGQPLRTCIVPRLPSLQLRWQGCSPYPSPSQMHDHSAENILGEYSDGKYSAGK